MPTEKQLDSEIPALVKKYVPGINRGLSWAKYGKDKAKGNSMKSQAFAEAREQGLAAALSAPIGVEGDKILKDTISGIWIEAKALTSSAKKISETLNHQPTKEERDKVLEEARKAARKAGLQAAIAAGWEKGWEEGIIERDSSDSD
tara:strand:+ start:418 stop:855 length:438 start_codon:yes stop_codon:yes gene_type:complete